MTPIIHIEICKSPWKPNTFNLRIGDISGSTEDLGIFKEDVLKVIIEEIDKLINSPQEKTEPTREDYSDNADTQNKPKQN